MRTILLVTVALMSLTGAAHARKKPTGKGACEEGDQCKKGVCIEINDDSYCSQSCGSCPAGMYCDDKLFSTIDLKVCVKGSRQAPPTPKTPPRFPCKTDNQCPGALICAEMMGQRDCTITCKSNSQCKAPEMMGVKMDFMECGLDESKRGRKACLPKRACLANPMACMTVNPQGMGNALGAAMGMVQAMEQNTPTTTTTESHAHEPAPHAAPPHATSKTQSMSESRFGALLNQLRDAGFENERNAVLDTAAKRNRFTADQVGRIFDVISFGDERISALRILASRIVDKENSHTILARLEFDDEKEKARKILNR